MRSQKEIKRRIQAVRGTVKITNAMRLIAAAKIKASERAVFDGRPYASGVYDVAKHISMRLGPGAPALWRRPVAINCVDAIVITSNRGLCGGFNENLLRFVEDRCLEHAEHNIRVKLYAIGRKGWRHLSSHGCDVEMVPTDSGREKAIEWVVGRMKERFLSGASAGGVVCFNRYMSSSRYRVRAWNLLPLYSYGGSMGDKLEYIFEPDRESALDRMADEILISTVRQAMLESDASEQAARILAMTSATKNAHDMIDFLTVLYNKARQEAITKELLDIVGGAEALRMA